VALFPKGMAFNHQIQVSTLDSYIRSNLLDGFALAKVSGILIEDPLHKEKLGNQKRYASFLQQSEVL
jgi:hypothetical protein